MQYLKTGATTLLPIILGSLCVFGFSPFDAWYVPLICFAILLVLELRFGLTLVQRYLFFLAYFVAGLHWVYVAIANFGGLPAIIAGAMVLLLCGYLALFPWLAWHCSFRFMPLHRIPAVLPLMWFVCEYARSVMLTGFPWYSLGYSQLGGPFSGWYAVIGETGLSVILLYLLCCVTFWSYGQFRKHIPEKIPFVLSNGYQKRLIMAAFGILIGTHYSHQIEWATADGSAEPRNVVLIQGNIEQSLRWQPEMEWPTMQKYLQLTEPHWNADIIVWPEAAIPRLEAQAIPYLETIDQLASSNKVGLVTGIVNYDHTNQQVFNTLLALGVESQEDDPTYQYLGPNRFRKHHLLPIGEFVPFESWLRNLAPIFDLPMSSFTRGEYVQPNLQVNGWWLAPAICFEIVFPRQLRANLTSETNAIVTVSNDAWFTGSIGPAQHQQIAQVRALEFALPVIRATNTGISSLIGPTGELLATAAVDDESYASAKIQAYSGITPYRKFGELPITLCILIIFTLNLLFCNKSRVN